MKKLIEVIKNAGKRKVLTVVAVAGIYLFMVVQSIVDGGSAELSEEYAGEESAEENHGIDEPYPERKKTEYHSDSAQLELGGYGFIIDNMELIDEEEFPQNQVANMMNAVREYLHSNSFEESITVLSVVEETVYYDQECFGLDLCLNDSMLDYVKVTGNGEKITCTDDNYGEPPELLEEDKEEIERIHQETVYLPDIEYDYEDFPYDEQDICKLVQDYYADMSGNYYENYKKYGADIQKYMEQELEYFNYAYSTYKYNTNLLKKELSNGNEEINVSVWSHKSKRKGIYAVVFH